MARDPLPPDDAQKPLDPRESAFLSLHSERESLERALVLAQQHQRFGADAASIEAARLREAELLKELDRVMTLIRAAEYQRRPGARRW